MKQAQQELQGEPGNFRRAAKGEPGFSLKTMAVRLRGGDTSYEARLSKAVRELQETEDAMKQAQQELECVG